MKTGLMWHWFPLWKIYKRKPRKVGESCCFVYFLCSFMSKIKKILFGLTPWPLLFHALYTKNFMCPVCNSTDVTDGDNNNKCSLVNEGWQESRLSCKTIQTTPVREKRIDSVIPFCTLAVFFVSSCTRLCLWPRLFHSIWLAQKIQEKGRQSEEEWNTEGKRKWYFFDFSLKKRNQENYITLAWRTLWW